MRTYFVAVALVAALALPAVAAAKGPSSASISGPSARTLAITGNGELPGNPLGTLANGSGFFAQMFGQTPDPTMTTRPKGTLGPRYTAVYVVPGPSGERSRVVQYLYPHAKPFALSYMKPGQVFWGVEKAHGGWFRASPAVKRLLVGGAAKRPS